MDEYEALVRSLVTERFTQWSPRSSNGNHVECFERTPENTSSRPKSNVRAQVHHVKSSPEGRNVK
jgi:hypothetical protein